MATPRTILIVDDDQDGAASLGLLLQVSGHEPVVCYDARAALELLATLRPEIMLVDLSMPVMDGYDLCRHVRSLPWGDEPFIFALTGWMHVEGDAAAVGFDGCLLKPCSLDQLKALLEHPGGTSMRARGTRRGPAAVLPPNPGNVEQA